MNKEADRPIVLKHMKPEDIPVCLRIWRAAVDVAHPFLAAKELDAEENEIATALRSGISVTVALNDSGIAGFIALIDGAIAGLFVHPVQQGQGIGVALLRDAVSAGGGRSVEVYARNLKSVGFYARMGFVEVGRRREDNLGRPHELIVMSRRISPVVC